MKKKILFPLVCVLAMALTSCFENTGYSYTSDFSRVVTIDRTTSPLQFVADYTGEKFKCDNLTQEEQLSLYGLENSERIIAEMHFAVDNSYKQTLTFVRGSAITVNPVWNKALPDTSRVNPLTYLFPLQLDSWSYPSVWMAGRYLNILPVVRSVGRGKFYLRPTSVQGDTLCFDMAAEYTPSEKVSEVHDLVNFDLGTLVDTADAEAPMLHAVRQMVDVIKANDSVCVMVTADYRSQGFVNLDTIVQHAVYTEYSTALKAAIDKR